MYRRMKHNIFPGWDRFFSFPSFASVLPEECVENLEGRSDVLRDNICHRIMEETVGEYLSASAEPPRQQEQEDAFSNASS